MPLILVVYDQNLVRLVLIDAELRENLIFLNIFGWETEGVGDMSLGIVFKRTKIKQYDLGESCLNRWAFGRIGTFSENLNIV